MDGGTPTTACHLYGRHSFSFKIERTDFLRPVARIIALAHRRNMISGLAWPGACTEHPAGAPRPAVPI